MTSKFDIWIDATAQAELVRSKSLTPSELLEATIAHAEAVNPRINALIIPLYDKARAEAKAQPTGPFAGVPYVVKDLTVVSKGDLNTSSIKGVKAASYRADHDSYFVRRMRDAGFLLMGRVNTPELGTHATTEPEAWGPCRNPWDLERSVGGSSGGSAAAVAAGIAPVAHGNDAGGSVRAPASICGVVGIKPTRGRISSGPMVTDSDNVSGLAHEGLMARSVRDIAGFLDVVSGRHPGDSFSAPPPLRPFSQEVGADPGSLRIGVLLRDAAGDFEVDAEWAATARKAADALAGLGHKVSDAFPKALDDRTFLGGFMHIADVAIAREIERYGRLIGRDLTEADVEWSTWEMVQRAKAVTGSSYAEAVDSLREYAGRLESWWDDDGWDLLVTPTVGRKQAKIGQLLPTKASPFVDDILPVLAFTSPYNASGQPAISLPLGESSDGLPIGVQLVAAHGREDLLLRVSRQLEQAMPWADRRPALLG